jgi:amidophosphoribosyltransferase
MELHEECGVFGVYSRSRKDLAGLSYRALYALQHRGQESAGIALNDDGVFTVCKDTGLVAEVFSSDRLEALGEGNIAVGHVRYSTTGTDSRKNAQPLHINHFKGQMVLAHNGNLTNAFGLRRELENMGAVFHTTSDTEVIAYVIVQERRSAVSIEAAVSAAMYRLDGAYSMVISSPTKLIAVRDPHGFRPLCMGRLPNDETVFASETCALDAIGAEFIRDIEPGEIVTVSKDGIQSDTAHCGRTERNLCVFEYIYFSRPDSVIDGNSVHLARQRAGEFLAEEHPVDADIVVGVPDSGIDAAIGFSRKSGIPYGIGFIKNKYIGRTFISPEQKQREREVRIKLNPLRSTVGGKRVVLIDDSIVRGTTSRHIVSLLRKAGAKEIHMRISAPPFVAACYYGTDIDNSDNLIANHLSVSEIAEMIGADTLGYLSEEHLLHIIENNKGLCTACFDENYPTRIPSHSDKSHFEYRIHEIDGRA